MNRQSNPTHEHIGAPGAARAWLLVALAVVALLVLPSCGLSEALEKAGNKSTGGGSSSGSSGGSTSQPKITWTLVNASPFTIKASPGGVMVPGASVTGSSNASSVTFHFYVRAGDDWIYNKKITITKPTRITIN